LFLFSYLLVLSAHWLFIFSLCPVVLSLYLLVYIFIYLSVCFISLNISFFSMSVYFFSTFLCLSSIKTGRCVSFSHRPSLCLSSCGKLMNRFHLSFTLLPPMKY
jgi:hypothetical protein